jgi:hypothetical protein
MMTGKPIPDPEDCDTCGCSHWDNPYNAMGACPHQCVFQDFALAEWRAPLADYSDGLKRCVDVLLRQYRADELSAADFLQNEVEMHFDTWRREDPDGLMYITLHDDLCQRQSNLNAMTGEGMVRAVVKTDGKPRRTWVHASQIKRV